MMKSLIRLAITLCFLSSCFLLPQHSSADSLIGTVGVGAVPANIHALGSKLYMVMTSLSQVTVMDTTNNATSTVTVGSFPLGITSLGTKLYVANNQSDTVSIIDTADNNSVTNVNVGDGPRGFAVLGSKIIVLNDGNSVSIINTADNNSVATVNTTADITFNNFSLPLTTVGTKIYVGLATNKVDVIDTGNNNSVTSINLDSGVGDTESFALYGTKLYAIGWNGDFSSFVISVINTSNDTATFIDEISGAQNSPISTVFGSNVYVAGLLNKLLVINANDDSYSFINSTLFNPEIPAFATVGSKLYVARHLASNSNFVIAVDTANSNALSTTTLASTAVQRKSKAITTIGTRVYVANESSPAGSSFVSIIETADITAPSVSLTAPTDGSSITSGTTVNLTATASDDTGVVGVQFKLDDTTNIEAEDTTDPYSINWNTTGVSAGNHTLSAVARDAAGNYATSTINITIASASSGGSGYAKNNIIGKVFYTYIAPNPITITTNTSTPTPPTPTPTPKPDLTPTPTPAPTTTFTKDLYFGLVDPEVRLIQIYLNTHGYTVTSSGNGSPGQEINRFGPAIRSALSRFQQANNITPSVGYFGPITRAFVNGK